MCILKKWILHTELMKYKAGRNCGIFSKSQILGGYVKDNIMVLEREVEDSLEKKVNVRL